MPSDSNPRQPELVAWLTERGHTPAEVAKILAKVADYDARTINESIFDSIGSLSDDEILKFLDEATGGPSPDEPK